MIGVLIRSAERAHIFVPAYFLLIAFVNKPALKNISSKINVQHRFSSSIVSICCLRCSNMSLITSGSKGIADNTVFKVIIDSSSKKALKDFSYTLKGRKLHL